MGQLVVVSGIYKGFGARIETGAERTTFFFFSLISLIADGPHHYHPACGH